MNLKKIGKQIGRVTASAGLVATMHSVVPTNHQIPSIGRQYAKLGKEIEPYETGRKIARDTTKTNNPTTSKIVDPPATLDPRTLRQLRKH